MEFFFFLILGLVLWFWVFDGVILMELFFIFFVFGEILRGFWVLF